MQKTSKTRGAILGYFLYSLIFTVHAKSALDGDYVRLTNVCWSTGVAKPEYECSNPVEEGVAIQHIKGSSFFTDIRTEGGNGHKCFYQGIGKMKNGVIETRSRDSDCGANIKIIGNIANIEQVGTCYEYCGARATLGSSRLKKKTRSKNLKIKK